MSLSDSQKSQLHDLLDQQEKAVRATLAREAPQNGEQSYAELATPVGDEGERAYAEQVVDERLAMTGHLASELDALAQARARLLAGTYGICVDCDEDVPFERLLACPTALRCEHCQTVREHVQRQHSPPG